MKTIYKAGGVELVGAFVLDGIAYPANWLELAAPGELASRGIVTEEVDDTPPVTENPGAPAPAPQLTVTQRQARLALLEAGLLDQVQAAVNAQGGAAKITWEYASYINRDDAIIKGVWTSLGLSDAAIDLLFKKASLI